MEKLKEEILALIERYGEITHQTENEMIVVFPIHCLIDLVQTCHAYFDKDEHPTIIIKGFDFGIDIMLIYEYYGIE
jgi:hypothetical protein